MSILMGGSGDGSMTNLEGLDLLNFIVLYGKGEPRLVIDRVAPDIRVTMKWLDWECSWYSQDSVVEAMEGVARKLEQAIEDGLLKEDTSG